MEGALSITCLSLQRKLTRHEMKAKRCHQIRTDFLPGIGLLDLVEMHSWHFAARDATKDAYAADFALMDLN